MRGPCRQGPRRVLQSFEDMVKMLENQLWEKRQEAEAERVQRHAKEWGGERRKTHYEFHGPEVASGDCSRVGQSLGPGPKVMGTVASISGSGDVLHTTRWTGSGEGSWEELVAA